MDILRFQLSFENNGTTANKMLFSQRSLPPRGISAYTGWTQRPFPFQVESPAPGTPRNTESNYSESLSGDSAKNGKIPAIPKSVKYDYRIFNSRLYQSLSPC